MTVIIVEALLVAGLVAAGAFLIRISWDTGGAAE